MGGQHPPRVAAAGDHVRVAVAWGQLWARVFWQKGPQAALTHSSSLGKGWPGCSLEKIHVLPGTWASPHLCICQSLSVSQRRLQLPSIPRQQSKHHPGGVFAEPWQRGFLSLCSTPVPILFSPGSGNAASPSSSVSPCVGSLAVGTADTGVRKLVCPTPGDSLESLIHQPVSHCPSHGLFLRSRGDRGIGSCAHACPASVRAGSIPVPDGVAALGSGQGEEPAALDSVQGCEEPGVPPAKRNSLPVWARICCREKGWLLFPFWSLNIIPPPLIPVLQPFPTHWNDCAGGCGTSTALGSH